MIWFLPVASVFVFLTFKNCELLSNVVKVKYNNAIGICCGAEDTTNENNSKINAVFLQVMIVAYLLTLPVNQNND